MSSKKNSFDSYLLCEFSSAVTRLFSIVKYYLVSLAVILKANLPLSLTQIGVNKKAVSVLA